MGAKQWMPKVGQVIRAEKATSEWVEAEVLKLPEKKGEPIPCQQADVDGHLFYAWKWKPLKTEADKKRDEQIKAITKILSGHFGDPDIEYSTFKQQAECLFESDVRAIAPDEYAVKALTDEQIREICMDCCVPYPEGSNLAEAIQRELGIEVSDG